MSPSSEPVIKQLQRRRIKLELITGDARSKERISQTLGSWVLIPLEAWIFVRL
jgi:cation transport ATPase